MDIWDEVWGQFERSHRLAKKYYDAGKIAKARVEYAKCAQFLEHLAQLRPEKKTDLLERSKKFKDIAGGLRDGTVKVYTDGVIPAKEVEPRAAKVTDQEKAKERVKDLILVEKPKVKFTDIAGLDDVKERIKDAIVYPFIYPEEYKYFGVNPGDGIMLYGPPGCGKTLLAAAAAAECDAVFINLKISDIKDKYVGESEKNIKQVFELARSYEKAIMFFDEIDAIAAERSGGQEGYERSLVDELLTQMSGLESKGSHRNGLVLAATNRPWDVDIALRRSERFTTKIFIPQPDLQARQKIFEINLRNMPVDKTVNPLTLAQITEGYASAEIANICQEAARVPLGERIREKKPRREIGMSDFKQAISKQETVLPSWYSKALKEIEESGEADMFGDLVRAGSRYKIPERGQTRAS